MAELGCLADGNEISVQVLYTCGQPLCNLTNLVSLQWNRVLDDISTASVQVALTGSGDDPCCECLADIHPWCAELAIYRQGILEWIGPITRVTYSRTLVSIEAEDMLAWLRVRVPQGVFDNVGSPDEIGDIALQMLTVAFAEKDPCLLDYVVQTDLNIRPTLFSDMEFSAEQFPAYEGTFFDWFLDLSEVGLDFTTIGRSILIGGSNFNLPPLGTLMDHHILGDIEIVRDGELFANRWYIRHEQDETLSVCQVDCKAENGNVDCALCADNGFTRPCVTVPCPAIVDAEDQYCYGLVERVNKEGVPFNITTAQQAGAAYLAASNPEPMVLSFTEGGARLAPNTPWELHDMIPGQRIDVALARLCLPIAQSFQLLEVFYELTAEGNESISMTLAPMNIATGNI